MLIISHLAYLMHQRKERLWLETPRGVFYGEKGNVPPPTGCWRDWETETPPGKQMLGAGEGHAATRNSPVSGELGLWQVNLLCRDRAHGERPEVRAVVRILPKALPANHNQRRAKASVPGLPKPPGLRCPHLRVAHLTPASFLPLAG